MKQLTRRRGPYAGWGGVPPGGTPGQLLVKASNDDGDCQWGFVVEGADPTGATDSTAAIQAAIDSGRAVFLPEGIYRAANLIQSADTQRIIALGEVKIVKNANGPIITSSGSNVEFNGIHFRGDSASPVYSGDGIVSTGNNFRLINCGCRWISGIPVRGSGGHVQILGTCDIYQTTDTSSTGWDIVLGISGTATLYHQISNIYTSQATGGIKFIDAGGHSVMGSQIGKLKIEAGTLPAGVNGGNFVANRVVGDVSVEISNSTFASNTFSQISLSLASGTSGHSVDESNLFAAGATITDNSTGSYVVDSTAGVPTNYTPEWTASVSNPSVGNGSIQGRYVRRGKEITASIRLVIGSSATFGNGSWFFSLPQAASTALPQIGSAVMLDSGTAFFVGSVQTSTDGTARCFVYPNNASNQISPTIPFTWASGDDLRISVSYFTD